MPIYIMVFLLCGIFSGRIPALNTMKFLAVIFFVGLTLTSARRIPSQNLDYSVDSYDELDLFDQSQVQNEEQRIGSEVAERLREILDRVLERFINLIDDADTESDGLETFVERIRELRQLLRERKEDLGVRARQILERIREKLVEVKDNLRRRLREIFEEDSGSAYAEVTPVEEDTTAEVAKRLREILDRVLDRIIRYLEDRKVSTEDSLETLVERIKEIGQIVKQRRYELGARGRQILERIRDRVQKLRQILGRKLREIFGNDSQSVGEYAENVQTDEDDTRSEVAERLREILDRVLERFINLIDEKALPVGGELETFIERVRELRKILRERREELGVRGKQILDRIRERLQVLRDRLSRRLQEIFRDSSRENTTSEVAQRLREVLDNLLDRIFKYLNESKVSSEDNLGNLVEKIKGLAQILRQRREELGVRGKEILERIRERIQELRNNLGRKLREIFGIDSLSVAKYEEDLQIDREEGIGSEVVEILKEILDRVLERFVNFIDEKRVADGDDLQTFVKRVNELRQILKEKREELGIQGKQIFERIRQRLQELRDRLRRSLREIFENVSRSAFLDVIPTEDDTASNVVQRLREVLERVLDKIIRYLDGRKVSADDNLETLVQRIKEFGQLLRERKGELGVRGRQILERIRDRIQELRQKLGRKLRGIFGIDSDALYVEGVPEEETDDGLNVLQRLRETLDKVVEKIRKFIDEGKVTSDDVFEKLAERIRELRQQLRDKNEDLRNKGREVLDNVRSRLRELRERWERKLREIFGIGSRPDGIYTEQFQADRDEDESLREKFDEIVQRIKDALKNGRSVKEALEQLRDLRQKLREKKSEFQGRIFEIFERLREKLREYLRNIFDNNDTAEKWNVSFREYLRKLREMVVDQIDIDKLETKVEEYFGKRSEIAERILNVLREKSGNIRQRVLAVIDTLLDENEEKRSLNDTYENIRDFFQDLAIQMRERYLKFGEWAKQKYEEGLERGRDKVERIRTLAREYINDLKIIGKDVREQGYEFFREYKEDLKNIWEDIRNKIQEIRSRE